MEIVISSFSQNFYTMKLGEINTLITNKCDVIVVFFV